MMRSAKQSANAGTPLTRSMRSAKERGTSSETTRRVIAKPKTASEKPSIRVTSSPRQRNAPGFFSSRSTCLIGGGWSQLVQAVERRDLVGLGKGGVVEDRVAEVVHLPAQRQHRLPDVHDLGGGFAEDMH